MQTDVRKHAMYRRFMGKKSARKRTIRYGLLAANVVILLAVVAFVAHTAPAQSQDSQNAVVSDKNVQNPLDQLSSADIAVHVARVTHLDEATSVANKADTVNAQLAIAPADNIVTTKPQVVASGLKSRKDIQQYTAKQGDSVGSIAAAFGVTSDTIRWSNNVTGDSVSNGQKLVISPINGIAYQVKAGDTVEALATKYNTNKDQIIAFNDIEIGGLPVGQYIVLPGGSPQQVATTTRGSLATIAGAGGFAWGGYNAVYGSNGYDYGYCTWWAANRRAETGRPIPSNLGNAATWKVLAQRAGLGVGNTPQAGAVIWTPPRDYYGHVGYVESVNSDGSVNISEMNVVGWGSVDKKTLSASEAAGYSYIY